MSVPKRLLGLALFASLLACGPQEEVRADEVIGSSTQDVQLSIKNADPSIIRVDSTYISAEADAGRIYVRMASSVNGLASAVRQQVWGNPSGWAEVWAPQIIRDGTTYYIYFTAGPAAPTGCITSGPRRRIRATRRRG